VESDDTTWHLEVSRSADRTVLHLRGEFDLVTAPQILGSVEEHLAAPTGELVMDLRGLSFIDSSGLSALIRMNQRLAGAGRGFSIVPPPHNVAKVFQITGLDQVLPLQPA